MAWPEWATPQRHARLFRSTTSFLIVAPGAGSHEVCPDVPAATRLGHDVIHRELLAPRAILAAKAVPPQDVPAGEHDPAIRYPHVESQAHDARPWEIDAR